MKEPFEPKARRINDAAKALGVCRGTIYGLAKKDKLKLIRIGRRTLVPESEIDRLVAEGSSNERA